MFVKEVETVGLDFLDTLTSFPRWSFPRLSPSSYSDKLLGKSLDNSKNSPLSLIYCAGMSWKGEAKVTPAARVALSVAGTTEDG